jgi:FPC/CPF motif-containing protein YcgG
MPFAPILQHASKYFEKLHQDEKFARKISQTIENKKTH